MAKNKKTRRLTTHEQKEIKRLSGLVDQFAGAVKARLAEKVRRGYGGWDELLMRPPIAEALHSDVLGAVMKTLRRNRVQPKIWVDIAARTMMLWNPNVRNKHKR